MKQLIILLAILGAYPLHAVAQDTKGTKKAQKQQSNDNFNQGKRGSNRGFNEVNIDTTIIYSDGINTMSFSYSLSNNEPDTTRTVNGYVRYFSSPSAVREFDESQRQILRMASEEAEQFSKWREEQNAKRQERIKQYWKNQRVILFTELMSLTTDEAERFWPMYNDFSAKKEDIMQKRQLVTNKLRLADLNIGAKEAEELNKEYLNTFSQESRLEQEYLRKFQTILKANKILMIYKAEYELKIMMLKSRGIDY